MSVLFTRSGSPIFFFLLPPLKKKSDGGVLGVGTKIVSVSVCG